MATKKQIDFREFECPECDANNPYPDGFRIGDTVFCNWCGNVFDVRKDGEDPNKFKLKPA